MFSPGIEPGTFCVLDRCDNRYTTKTAWYFGVIEPWEPLLLLICVKTSNRSTYLLVLSRDRLVVRTLRCGRSNPGSNPGHGMDNFFFLENYQNNCHKNCVGRESNPDQLLGRQLCWPLYHRRIVSLMEQYIDTQLYYHCNLTLCLWVVFSFTAYSFYSVWNFHH